MLTLLTLNPAIWVCISVGPVLWGRDLTSHPLQLGSWNPIVNHAHGLGMLLWCVPEGGRASLANSLEEKCLLGGVFEKQQWFLRLFPLISLRLDRGHFQIGDMYPQNCPFSLSFWPVQAALFSIKFSVVSVHLYLSLSLSVICFRHLCLSLSISVLYLCYLCFCHLCLYLSSSLSISPLLPAASLQPSNQFPFLPLSRGVIIVHTPQIHIE